MTTPRMALRLITVALAAAALGLTLSPQNANAGSSLGRRMQTCSVSCAAGDCYAQGGPIANCLCYCTVLGYPYCNCFEPE